MNEQNTTNTDGKPEGTCCAGGDGTCSLCCQLQWAFNRALKVIKDPVNVWTDVKADTHTVSDIFLKYLVFICAITPIATLVRGFYGGHFMLGMVIGQYILALLSVLLVATIVKFVSPPFGGTSNFMPALQLVAYSITPGLVGGIFNLLPSLVLAGVLGFVCQLYGIYVLAQGVVPILSLPQEKKVLFVCVIIAAVVVVSAVLGIILGAVIVGSAMHAGMM